MTTDEHWMNRAIDAARTGIRAGQSPFGAAIIRGDELIAATHNHVWLTTDPTAHAEVRCIRDACRTLRTIDLSACRMYTTCEPCPMCASAIHWSKLASVAYGATIADAQHAGFSELTVPCTELLSRGGSRVRVTPALMPGQCAALFDEWKAARGAAY
jgi:guanine deaminase